MAEASSLTYSSHSEGRKLGIAHADNANGQMRCKIDAAEEEDSSQNKVRADGENAQRKFLDGDSPDRALHQGNHAGQA